MTVLVGFDDSPAFLQAAPVPTPIVLGATLVSVAIPPGVTVGGIDLDVSDLDGAAVAAIRLDVGDAADVDRYVANSDIAQNGGRVMAMPLPDYWYRYSVAGVAAVNVTVKVAPATGVPGGISLQVYGYHSVDVAVLARQVLQRLGVVAEGETARAEDAALANEALADTHEMLRHKGLARRQDLAWPLALVPLFAARSYTALAGNLLTDVFGLSTRMKAEIADHAAKGEQELRRQTRLATSYQPVDMDPYKTPGTAITDYNTVLG